MKKYSFTLLETLISAILLSIVTSGFLYSSYFDKQNEKLFTKLNDLENIFNTKEYKLLPKTNKNLTIIVNDNIIKNLTVYQYEFNKNNIKLIRYEK